MSKKYQIVCSEEQLRMIANAVEDWSRFLGGQCELWNATSMLENSLELRTKLQFEAHPMVTPLLPMNAAYGWNGGSCPNEYQRRAIAMSYGIYRQILHFFAVERAKNTPGAEWNTYCSSTLTCSEQGGLIEVKEL